MNKLMNYLHLQDVVVDHITQWDILPKKLLKLIFLFLNINEYFQVIFSVGMNSQK